MIIFTALILLVMTALTVFVRTVIYNAQYNEVQRVYNIAGAVLSEYPQAEQIFVNAVMNEDHKNESYGENIMSHYGYDTEMELNKQYKKTLIVYYTVLLAFSVCILFGGYAGFRFISKRKKFGKIILSKLSTVVFPEIIVLLMMNVKWGYLIILYLRIY